MSSNVERYSPIDPAAKSITVPVGNGVLVGPIKRRLSNDGWQLAVDSGPIRTQGRIGLDTSLETYRSYNTRYRLLVNARQFDFCITGSAAIYYDLSLIDTKTGREVFAQSGRDCEAWAVEKFSSELNKNK